MQRFILIIISLIFFSCSDITPRNDNFGIHGVDVSRYQSDIDWEKVAAQDISFAFVKASEGESISDLFFHKNWTALKDAGIKRGAYHFFRPNTSVLTQAQNFIDNVIIEEGDLPPVLDIEVLDGVSKIALLTRVKTWLEIVELKYHIRPIIYTNLKFYNKYLADDLEGYPVWIARYNNFFEPMLVNNQDWVFWQYGNKGRLDGIEGDVDLNVFYGSQEELNNFCYKINRSISLVE